MTARRGGAGRRDPARGSRRGHEGGRPAADRAGVEPTRGARRRTGEPDRTVADRERREPRGLGGDRVEGRRAVHELLLAGQRPVRTVWMATGLDPDPTLDAIVELAGAALRRVPPERLAELAATDAPQGVVAAAPPLPEADLDGLLGAPGAFLVALDGVTDPRNLGAVLRAAETAGATGIVLPRQRSARVTAAAAKASAGAIEHLPIAAVSGIPAALERARRASVWSVGLAGDGDQPLFDLPLLAEPVMVVLGAEGRGLARLTRERCDVVARIPMRGQLGSLNVASAAALACHEVARVRARAGVSSPPAPE